MDENKVLENAPVEQSDSVPCTTPHSGSSRKRRFSGSHDHSIDSKGRMIIPTSFREGLGPVFVCSLSMDNKALALYPIEAWEAEEDRVSKLMETDRRAEKILVHMNKFAYTDCEMDAQGRVLLPAKLRMKILGDSRDVNISGAGSYIRVMTLENSLLEDEAYEQEFPDPLAFIASIQKKED